MQRIVFGLKDVYNAQCENAGIGLTSSALELNIPGLGYGYVGAGEFPNVREVSKFDFTTEITTNLGDLFPAERAQLQGLSGPNFGYFGGMYGPPNTFFSTINRIDYSNDTFATPPATTSQSVNRRAGLDTENYGYFVAGAPTSKIDRIDFATETTSSPGDVPSPQLQWACGVSQSSYGYLGGGEKTALTSDIIRMDFSVETIATPSTNLTTNRAQICQGIASQTYGYFGGGYIGPPGLLSCTIDRLDFSAETTSLNPNSMSIKRSRHSAFNSPFFGYFINGNQPPYTCVINRLDFSTDTTSSPTPTNRAAASRGAFDVNRPQVFRHVPGNSVWKEEPNYGYWGGGATPVGGPNVSTVDRIDYASETVSAPGNNLIQTANATGAVQNSNYGYFGGGQASPAVCTISRLEFATETVINSTSKLNRSEPVFGGISGPDKGYFAGFGPEKCSVDRLDFTTETLTSNPSQLGQPKREPSGTQNDNYGYIMGGKSNAVPIDWSTINRVDFATDIFSTISSALPQGRRNTACVENTKNAYICLGGDTVVCTVERMEFSTETVSAIDGFGPPRWAPGGNSSFSYGYVGGGKDNNIPDDVSTINRLDFDTETSSTPSSKLTQKRRLVSSVQGGVSTRRVGKATYGYIAGGESPGGASSIIDRIDFTTETSAPSAVLPKLPSATQQLAGGFNSNYGYWAGGGPPHICTITRLDFSNETTGANSSQLTQARRWFAGVSNSNYAYFAGGYTGAAFSTVIDRLDFATESVSSPRSYNLPQARNGVTSVWNSNYGYWGGGYPRCCTIDRLDFSSETTSVPSSSLTQARDELAAASSKSYGYFAGGSVPGGCCTIDRIDFTTEVVSTNPGQLTQARNGLTGSYNSDYGYFTGGVTPLANTTTIDRLDFAADTVSLPSQSLTQARTALTGLANG